MKVHSADRCLKLPSCPKEIPDGLLNEEWAQRNHDQSLARLNERGGITLAEALAIIWKRPWHDHPDAHAISTMLHLINGYNKGIEKIKEAVKLAREFMVPQRNAHDIESEPYTEEEIIKELKL